MTLNCFSRLPYDVKVHEIADFLDHSDVLAFNEVLRRDERVYKKLPADFALKVHILAMKQKYTSIASKVNNAFCDVSIFRLLGESRPPRAALMTFLATYKQLFAFFADPNNSPIFTYQRDLKDKQAALLDYWQNDAQNEEPFFPFLTSKQVAEFQKAAFHAATAISSTSFVRHISLSGESKDIF